MGNMKKINAFSDEAKNISILVYSKHFVNDSEKLRYFFNAAKLGSVKICFTPFEQTETVLKIPEYIQFCKYSVVRLDKQIRNMIQFPSGREVSFIVPQEEMREKCCYDEIERVIKRIDARDYGFHYAVCSDEWEGLKDCKFSTIPFLKCREVLRLFLIANEDFSFTERFETNEHLYYIYRHKVMFRKFQGFWSASVARGGELEWEGALDNRLQLIALGLDKVRIDMLKRQDNTRAMYLQYHMGYLLLLITGTFDNLAWIINNLYQLDFDKMKIDIVKREFFNAVSSKSNRMARILSDENIKRRVLAIRELRDRVVHRDFIKTISTIEQDEKTYIWIDEIAANKLLIGDLPSSTIKLKIGNRLCIDCFDFSQYLQRCVVLVVNSRLEVISEEMYGVTEEYNIEKLLKFPEPYVL